MNWPDLSFEWIQFLPLLQRSTEQLTNRCSTATLEEVLDNQEGITSRTVSEKIMNVCKNTIRWVLLVDVLIALSGNFLSFNRFIFPSIRVSTSFLSHLFSDSLLLRSTFSSVARFTNGIYRSFSVAHAIQKSIVTSVVGNACKDRFYLPAEVKAEF